MDPRSVPFTQSIQFRWRNLAMAACCLRSNIPSVVYRDGHSFVTASKGAVRPVLALLTLPGLFAVTSFAQINSSYFGLAISGNAGVVWPSAATQPLKVSAVRAWDSGTRWDQIETAKGVYSWTTLDAFIAQAQAQGQEVLYTFGGVPEFSSAAAQTTHPAAKAAVRATRRLA
jgi:hypothetical protein